MIQGVGSFGVTGAVSFTFCTTGFVGATGVESPVVRFTGACTIGVGVTGGAIVCHCVIPVLVCRLCSALPHTAFTPCCTSWLVIGAVTTGVGAVGDTGVVATGAVVIRASLACTFVASGHIACRFAMISESVAILFK